MNRSSGSLVRVLSIVSLSGAAVVLSFFRLRSTDVFWHLAAGRWILEHRAVPMTDPFRFTSGGAP